METRQDSERGAGSAQRLEGKRSDTSGKSLFFGRNQNSCASIRVPQWLGFLLFELLYRRNARLAVNECWRLEHGELGGQLRKLRRLQRYPGRDMAA
ncbi:hypothetical protein CGCSCA5_v013192 [Colletotrichum siamense]|nr:hypothetical protein CGCSCA5_v013192 [Colletotrichum siamense]KAF4871219.1 hypothetical protein CGCSCA1_v009462 [Colletotrichum siamense]